MTDIFSPGSVYLVAGNYFLAYPDITSIFSIQKQVCENGRKTSAWPTFRPQIKWLNIRFINHRELPPYKFNRHVSIISWKIHFVTYVWLRIHEIKSLKFYHGKRKKCKKNGSVCMFKRTIIYNISISFPG